MLSIRQEVLYGMVLVHRILVAYTVCLVSVCDLRICRLVNRLQPSPSKSAVGGRKIPTTGSVPSTRPALIRQQCDSPASVQLTGAFVIKKPARQISCAPVIGIIFQPRQTIKGIELPGTKGQGMHSPRDRAWPCEVKYGKPTRNRLSRSLHCPESATKGKPSPNPN